MDLSEFARVVANRLSGSDSWYNFTKRRPHRRDIRDLYHLLRGTPLYPMVGWADWDVTPRKLPHFFGAYRDPVALLHAWHQALLLGGRVTTVSPLWGVTVFIKGDGVQDKMNGCHVGFTFCHDTNFFSSHAQQDFVVGRLSEKNQVHMGLVARFVRDMTRFCEAHGVTVLVGGDWEWLRTTGRGMYYTRGGAGWALPSKSMFFVFYHGTFTRRGLVGAPGHVTPPWPRSMAATPSLPWEPPYTRRQAMVPVASGLYQG